MASSWPALRCEALLQQEFMAGHEPDPTQLVSYGDHCRKASVTAMRCGRWQEDLDSCVGENRVLSPSFFWPKCPSWRDMSSVWRYNSLYPYIQKLVTPRKSRNYQPGGDYPQVEYHWTRGSVPCLMFTVACEPLVYTYVLYVATLPTSCTTHSKFFSYFNLYQMYFCIL